MPKVNKTNVYNVLSRIESYIKKAFRNNNFSLRDTIDLFKENCMLYTYSEIDDGCIKIVCCIIDGTIIIVTFKLFEESRRVAVSSLIIKDNIQTELLGLSSNYDDISLISEEFICRVMNYIRSVIHLQNKEKNKLVLN